MSVKSTRTLTREQAEDLYFDLLRRNNPRPTVPYSNKTLEEFLETLNDEANGGEGFENYVISEDQS